MLNILVAGIDQAPTGMGRDVEEVFAGVTLTGTEKERKVIEFVEGGSYLDEVSFIDKFGYKLPREFLSSGTKAVLSVLNLPNTAICCLEIGYNAFSALIRFCSSGTVYVNNFPYPVITAGCKEIDVMYRGTHFRRPDSLAEYMKLDWPYEPEGGE